VNGFIGASEAEMGVGAVVAIIGVGWSMFDKWRAAKAGQPAA
jgi:hypothetical protein